MIDVAEFVSMLKEIEPGAEITIEDNALPFPADLSDAGLRGLLGDVPHTPMREAIAADLALYRQLIAEKRIDLAQLDA